MAICAIIGLAVLSACFWGLFLPPKGTHRKYGKRKQGEGMAAAPPVGGNPSSRSFVPHLRRLLRCGYHRMAKSLRLKSDQT